ncbi:hypothetical protein D3C72_2326940 [compost metagenome]
MNSHCLKPDRLRRPHKVAHGVANHTINNIDAGDFNDATFEGCGFSVYHSKNHGKIYSG